MKRPIKRRNPLNQKSAVVVRLSQRELRQLVASG